MPQDATNSENELSEKQVLAIPHLVSSNSVSEAAELVGVNHKTIYRWIRAIASKFQGMVQLQGITVAPPLEWSGLHSV